MHYWKCTVCGYIHQGEEAPEVCPLCASSKDSFVECDADGTPLAEVKSTGQDAPQAGTTDPQPQPGGAAAAASSPLDQAAQLIMRHHLHPITVHTPNGILPLAFILLLLGIVFGAERLAGAAYYSLVFTLLAMPAVLFTGYIAWQRRYKGALTQLFKIKLTAAAACSLLLLLLVLWRLLNPTVLTAGAPGRWLYLLGTLLCLAAAGMAGHMGGKLVFGARK